MSKPEIVICLGSSCSARGNERNLEMIENYLQNNGLQDSVDVDFNCSLCQGKCSEGPNIFVDGKLYNHVDEGVTREILMKILPVTK
ncbi:MAG: (2Fe-2S) ferredoxin domain-containing protein [Lentisphaerae bacterium]|nr:(2Fe-2S) ferredoxin domain-containing protein [Lentisphaerota bacterium]MCP4101792.1 (2Fe-2S) ferredoxin domain-containing protein [Lentisphaerota bacterium]